MKVKLSKSQQQDLKKVEDRYETFLSVISAETLKLIDEAKDPVAKLIVLKHSMMSAAAVIVGHERTGNLINEN
jgi:hypothetical protein